MYVIMETGGKQYKVNRGDVLTVEKLDAEAGETVEITKVLALGQDDGFTVGKPYVEGAKVLLKILEQGKGDKILVFKYKPKKKYRKLRGHRQPYSKVLIDQIWLDGVVLAAEEAKAAEALDEAGEIVAAEEVKPAGEIETAEETASAEAPEAAEDVKPAPVSKPARKPRTPKAAKPVDEAPAAEEAVAAEEAAVTEEAAVNEEAPAVEETVAAEEAVVAEEAAATEEAAADETQD